MSPRSFSFKYAMKSIYRRKVRNLYAILGITLGVSLLLGVQVSMASSEKGWENLFLRSLGDYEAELIPVAQPFVNETAAWQLKQAAADINAIEAVTGRISLSSTAFEPVSGRIELGIPLEGVPANESGFGGYLDQDDAKIIDLNETSNNPGIGYVVELTQGINFTFQLTAPFLVGEDLADELNIAKGSDIILVYGEGTFRFNITKKVDYIYKNEERGREYGAMAIVTRLSNLQPLVAPLSGSPNSINRILINFDKSVTSSGKADDALDELRAVTGTVTDYNAGVFYYSSSKFTILKFTKELSNSLNQLLTIFGSLIILAGLLLIVNIQLMSVEEREQQVGILRAIGTQRPQILATTIIETILLGFIGSFLGILGGIVYGIFLIHSMAWTFGYPASEIPLVLNEMTVIMSFTIGFVIALLTSLLPAWRASRINVVEVIRGISPPEERKFGKKGLYFGIFLIVIGILWAMVSGLEPWTGTGAWKNIDDVDVLYFIILLPVIGLALTASYFFSKRWSLNIMAFALIAWPLYSGFVIMNWITEGSGGMYWIFGIIMALIAGSCIFIGVNLDYVALIVRKTVGIVPGMKAIALVAMEQMASKKIRSTLVFAIFSVVLTMNIFMANLAHSFRFGADETVELQAGGTDIIIVADQDIPKSFNFATLVENEFGTLHGVELVRGYSQSAQPTPIYLDEDDIHNYEEAEFCPLIPLDNRSFWRDDDFSYEGWAFQFDLIGKKAEELETATSLDQTKKEVKMENEAVWRFVADNSTIDGKPVVITTLIGMDFMGVGGVSVEDSIWIMDKYNQPIEFVIVGIFWGNALTDWPQALIEGPEIQSSNAIFISYEMTEKLLAFEDGINSESLFLVGVPDNKIRSKANNELAAEIEEWANGNEGAFRLAHGLYGIAGIPVWDIYAVELDGMYRMLTFLQLFTSGGFLVGVLGLLVVSMRSVQERKREIGMMRSLGFRKLDVTVAVLFELVLMGLIGLAVGLINGSIVAYFMVDVFSSGTTTYLIPWNIIAIYTAIILSSAFIAAIIPGWLASRIPPSDALRYVG